MTACGTVGAAHSVFGRTAPNAFQRSVSVHVLPGGSFKTAVAVGRRTAINTVFLIIIMHMKAVRAAGAPRTITC